MAIDKRLQERIALAERILRPTAVVPLEDERVQLFAKLEFLNGIGSIKDRPAWWIVNRAIERGEIGTGTTIVESSSGNFACSLATIARMLELEFIPVIDPSISPQYEALLRTQCASVFKVNRVDESGNYLKDRLRIVQELRSELRDSFWPNQYDNPDGMDAHYHITAAEIMAAVPHLDYVFLGVGSAGTISGVSRRLKEHNSDLRVVAVDVVGSVIFGRPARRRHIPGIGSAVSPSLLRHARIDDIVVVSEPETIAACHDLLRRHGLFVGGSSGSVYHAIQHYFAGERCLSRPRVLFLCSDRGTAYMHTIYDRAWSSWRLAAGSELA